MLGRHADTYASAAEVNVMRLEDWLGRIRVKPSRSIARYIGEVRSLANCLGESEVEITGSRLAHKILGGLGNEYKSQKAALRVRCLRRRRRGRLLIQLGSRWLPTLLTTEFPATKFWIIP